MRRRKERKKMGEMLRLPMGMENFKDIRTKGFYYVDKTALIEQLFDNLGMVNLFTRPRRFGKTLTMNMLKYFFEVGTDESLFNGLYISNNAKLCEEHLGKYPVISLTLKGVEASTFEAARDMFIGLIADEARSFSFLLESDGLSETDKNDYRALIAKSNGAYLLDGNAFRNSIKLLSTLLYKHYGKKVVILIDEYDVPLDKAYQNGYYNEMVSLIRSLFGNALKTNEYLEFAVLTGCLRVSKESIFTGLNNFKVRSITDERFDEEFGFTDKEVRELLVYYGMESHMTETKAWYDGYRFGNADIYCPWDVINHVDALRANEKARPRPYWINTSGNELLKRLIEKANEITKNDIERLIAGETIEKEIHEELTYNEIEDSIENIWSVLFTTGYLTMEEETELSRYVLRIPNEELRVIYRRQVLEWIRKSIRNSEGTESLNNFWKNFAEGNAEAVERYINTMLTRSISVLDIRGDDIMRESTYHMIVMTLLSTNPEWNTQSNVEAGEGYADIIVETDDIDAGSVIELKYARKPEDMEQGCKTAIRQIRDKRYYEYLHNRDRKDIQLYGIAFCKKRCRVTVEKLIG